MMLINVVFLLLAFFLVAGTLAARPPEGLALVSLSEGAPAPLPGVVVLEAGGGRRWPAGVADAAELVATLPPGAGAVARILPDRAAPATALLALAQELRAAGAAQVRIVAQREAE